jgi:hypothetical protein
MAFTSIQSTGAAGSNSATFLGTVTAGDLVVVRVAYQFTGSPISSPGVTDSEGNAYTLAVLLSDTVSLVHYSVSVWYSLIAAGGVLTVTYTPPGSNSATLSIAEYSFTGTLSLDAAVSSTGTGTSLTSGSMTTTGSSDLVAGAGIAAATGQTWTVGGGFSSIYSSAGSSGVPSLCAVDQLGVAPGSIAVAIGDSAGSAWVCAGAAFSEGIVPATNGAQTGLIFAARRPSRRSGRASSAILLNFSPTPGPASGVMLPSWRSVAGVRQQHRDRRGRASFLAPFALSSPPVTPLSGPSGLSTATVRGARKPRGGHARIQAGPGPGAGDLSALSASAMRPVRATGGRLPRRGQARIQPFTSPGTAPPVVQFAGWRVSGGGRQRQKRGHPGRLYSPAPFSLYPLVPPNFTPLGPVRPVIRARETAARKRTGQSFLWRAAPLGGPNPSIGYYVYDNAGAGPINYVTPVATVYTTDWVSGPLTYPDTWMFGVRAFDSAGIELNLEAAVTILLSATGADITNTPSAPIGTRAFATAGGGIRIEWGYSGAMGPKTPTSFNVYAGTPAISYITPVATVAWASAIMASFVANIGPFPNGTVLVVGVRAANATAEEKNTATVTVTAASVGPSAVMALTAQASV